MDCIIKGFRNQTEIDHFMDWFEGSGEQSLAIWFECRKAEKDDVEYKFTESYKGNVLQLRSTEIE